MHVTGPRTVMAFLRGGFRSKCFRRLARPPLVLTSAGHACRFLLIHGQDNLDLLLGGSPIDVISECAFALRGHSELGDNDILERKQSSFTI